MITDSITQQEQFTQVILNNVHDAIIIINNLGEIVYWNNSAHKLFGWSIDEVRGKNLGNLIVPQRYRKSHFEGISRFLHTQKGKILGEIIEIEAMHKNGKELSVNLTISNISFENSNFFVGIIRDVSSKKNLEVELHKYAGELEKSNQAKDALITELRDLKKELELSARTDPLTQIPNRRDMIEKLKYEFQRTRRTQKQFCVLMMDVDHFKTINDTIGHDGGDYVLIELANLLQDSSRKQDIICRWGGEEFLFLLPDTTFDGGVILANRLIKKTESHSFSYMEKLIPVTLSIGLGTLDLEEEDFQDCIKRADESLYKAKRLGRNRLFPLNEPQI